MVKFENREIWADLENRSKVVHSENFPIWRPASGHRDHVTSHVTHWGQWKYASRSWHAVGNHRRQLKLMYRSKISGRGPKHCSGSKFQCRPRPGHCAQPMRGIYVKTSPGPNVTWSKRPRLGQNVPGYQVKTSTGNHVHTGRLRPCCLTGVIAH